MRVNLLQKKGRSKRLFVRARSPVDLEDLSHILCQVPQKNPIGLIDVDVLVSDGCVFRRLAPMLMSYVKTGSPKQAKCAIRCIDGMCRSKDVIFKQLFEVRFYLCLHMHSITVTCRQLSASVTKLLLHNVLHCVPKSYHAWLTVI